MNTTAQTSAFMIISTSGKFYIAHKETFKNYKMQRKIWGSSKNALEILCDDSRRIQFPLTLENHFKLGYITEVEYNLYKNEKTLAPFLSIDEIKATVLDKLLKLAKIKGALISSSNYKAISDEDGWLRAEDHNQYFSFDLGKIQNKKLSFLQEKGELIYNFTKNTLTFKLGGSVAFEGDAAFNQLNKFFIKREAQALAEAIPATTTTTRKPFKM